MEEGRLAERGWFCPFSPLTCHGRGRGRHPDGDVMSTFYRRRCVDAACLGRSSCRAAGCCENHGQTCWRNLASSTCVVRATCGDVYRDLRHLLISAVACVLLHRRVCHGRPDCVSFGHRRGRGCRAPWLMQPSWLAGRVLRSLLNGLPHYPLLHTCSRSFHGYLIGCRAACWALARAMLLLLSKLGRFRVQGRAEILAGGAL